MNKNDLPPIAVIADAHFHDIQSHYDCEGITIDDRQHTLRSWADTRRSSRVFNESKAALKHALQDIQERGIKYVVLLGDYSDDGQIEANERLVDLLHQHRMQYGTCFFAITGNHDAFGPRGKHQSTRFVSHSSETILVTSDPDVAATEPESAILTPGMFCEGVPEAIARMSEFGLFRQAGYLHWETPFGQNDSVQQRQYDAFSADRKTVHQLVDASYLVEPVDGLWLLMIDANVFEPRNGQWSATQKKAFLDSSDAGWNSVLKNRPYLIDWITTVCNRANQAGKTLIAFSHYPIIDPFADADNSALKLFGDNEMIRRTPDQSVSTRLLDAGIGLHFSGHLHASALSQQSNNTHTIEDCMTPSLAAFPACYKIVHTNSDSLDIDTVQLSSMPLDQRLMQYYREENTTHCVADKAVLASTHYGEFLYHRMHTRVLNHYLVKEWPEHIAQSVLNTSTADLALLMLSRQAHTNDNLPANLTKLAPSYTDHDRALWRSLSQHGVSMDELAECPMTRLITDWYCLRHAGYLARAYIGPQNSRIYVYLADTFGDLSPTDATKPGDFFAIFLGMLQSSMQRSEESASRERTLLP